MNIKTVIFDLDGTLLDTLDDLTCGFNYALKKRGYKERTKEEFKLFVGNGVKKALERATENKAGEKELEEITRCFKEYYKQNGSNYTKPYDGITELLRTLKQKGYTVAVLSNKFDAAVKLLCKKYFDGLTDFAIGEGNGIRRKPSTDGIEMICKLSGSKPEECIFAGDSDTDILTAKNAGIPCISVTWGFRTKEFLLKSGAEMIAETPSDFLKLIA